MIFQLSRSLFRPALTSVRSINSTMASYKLIDIGANLTDLMYEGEYHGKKKHSKDLSAVLDRAFGNGVERLIVTGGSLEESRKAIELAKTDERLFATVGCHPTRCGEFDSSEEGPEGYLNSLSKLVEENRETVVALGEMGLDYDRTQFCEIETQKKYFELQLRLAESLNIPMFLHCRNAAGDLTAALAEYGTGMRGVVHSFDGSAEEAKSILDLGYYIGVNGCSLKTEENLTALKTIPSDRLLLETDCPWCDVRPSHAGHKFVYTKLEERYGSVKKPDKWKEGSMVKGRNEPCNIVSILEIVAAVKGEKAAMLCDTVYQNTMKLFF